MKQGIVVVVALAVAGVAAAVWFGPVRSSAAAPSPSAIGMRVSTSFVPGNSIDVGALYVRQAGPTIVDVASIRFSCTGCVTRLYRDLHTTRGVEHWTLLHTSPPAIAIRYDPHVIDAGRVATRAQTSLESDSFNHSPVTIITLR